MSHTATTGAQRHPSSSRSRAAFRWFAVVLIPVCVWLLRGVLSTELFYLLFVGSVYAIAIGFTSTTLLAGSARRMWKWSPWAFWPTYLGMVAVCALIGSAIAAAVFWFARIFPQQYFWEQTRSNTILAFFISYAMAIVMLRHGNAVQRLADTQAALREQQMHAERNQKMLAQSQLTNLKSQLHPHFLFNSLNSVAALIPDDPARAEEMLVRVCDILRVSLDTHSQQMVTIRRELELVEAYAAVQRIRFGDRLSVQVHADQQLLDALAPAFSLQPLVENCVKYVAGLRHQPTHIRVSVRARHNHLIMEVEDDGDGFDESALLDGHSLNNLRARLQAVFPSQGELTLQRAGLGMRVRVTLPLEFAQTAPQPEAATP